MDIIVIIQVKEPFNVNFKTENPESTATNDPNSESL